MPNADEITAALRSISWPLSGQRRSVQPDGVPEIEAMCLGMSWGYSGQRAALLALLASVGGAPKLDSIVDKLCKKTPDESFTYTGTQLSRGYNAATHTDSKNAESPYIVGSGGYSGDEQGEQRFEVARKIPGYQL